MHYRIVAATCLVAALAFGAVSTVMGQNKQPAPKPKEEPRKEEPKPEPKPEPKKEEPKKEEPKPEPMSSEDYEGMMKKIKTAQGKLKANLKNKKGAEAAAAAEELAKLAADILRYDGDGRKATTRARRYATRKTSRNGPKA